MTFPVPGPTPGEFTYDGATPFCPVSGLLDQIRSRWANLSLLALAAGPRRHAELRRLVPGVSQKMLTQALRMLERNGMVRRTITPTVPVRVDYALTDLGRSVLPLLWSIKKWSEANMAEMESERERYDEREPVPPVAVLNRRDAAAVTA
ncbi:transcriptional regulator [Actinorhabdospora filicis]|uniref:Transcriptional regulator n=1 Tax=Actinorhabdospora filicis TaxID=1785913 RepID=A0A9W6SR91_9ACTN|nr:helix-turn-helix domain-containing protein [Actinorhabdospora filicis]GLZ80866.1 transcriptional regulator [Actinorhabdospora filicis]